MLPVLDRFKGALLGLAVGDALGTTLEFKAPGSFSPIDDIRGGGPFGLNVGEWTDDTSMALCLAASLVERGEFDSRDQIDRYVRWVREGYMSSNGICFDVGGTVSAALSRYEKDGNPAAGSTAVDTAGNGSIMRLAPVPMFYYRDARLALRKSEESSLTTHGTQACLDACRYFGGMIWGALHGIPKEELLAPFYTPVEDEFSQRPLCTSVAAVAAGSFKTKMPPYIAGTGYVVQSLEAALWAFSRSSDFREGALLAVNLGYDADTTGAVYGQLAGAYYGLAGIPATWRGVLAHGGMIEDLAGFLHQKAILD
ncbi:MAG TPA: ADP-ribosylglycohydrolase family protein [Candidatus Methylacidiphilales bacterium]